MSSDLSEPSISLGYICHSKLTWAFQDKYIYETACCGIGRKPQRHPVLPNPEDGLTDVVEDFEFTLDKCVGEEQQSGYCFVHEPGKDLNTDYIHLIVVDPDYSTQNSLWLWMHLLDFDT